MDVERRLGRIVYAILIAATTGIAALRLEGILRVDGLTPLKLAFLVIFTILFAWIAASFWMAVFGAALYRRNPDIGPLVRHRDSRTAIVIPVHNEETAPLFAKLRAIYESVLAAGGGEAFDFYVLSDSTDPEHWLAEEFAWWALRKEAEPDARIFYRHRPDNTGRKTGNIRDFCENWGAHYDYMVVLDADSLMTGQTLLSLVGLMDAHPRTALIQVPPMLIGKQSLFARLQQFASSVYGPIYWTGLAFLQGPDGNYWGHNAILRVQAFTRHCGLPSLPGRAPLGGEILSHDFVEAALLRRAGWDIWMAPELGGSFEEPPTSLLRNIVRDRRWCQGNLQHMRLIFGRGFKGASRMHLTIGVMTYLSAPLWLLMLLVSTFESFSEKRGLPFAYNGRFPVLSWPMSHALEFGTLFGLAVVLLYGPKFLALFSLLSDRDMRRAHGGGAALTAGILVESLFSTLFAPVVMLSHVSFVADILLGRSTGWNPQQRGDGRTRLLSATRAFAPHTLFGAGAGLAAWHYVPDLFWWLTPVLAGPVFAIPLAILTSSPAVGRFLARARLLSVPSETEPLPIALRAAELPASGHVQGDPKARVLGDASATALHIALLRDVARQGTPLSTHDRNCDAAGFAREAWKSLLADADALDDVARQHREKQVA